MTHSQGENENIDHGLFEKADQASEAGNQMNVYQRLSQAQSMFERLFEATPDANLLVDQQGKIVMANHQAEKMFGFLREELIGQPVEMLMPSDYKDRHTSHRSHYQQAPRARPMGAGVDLYAQRKNGTRFPADITLSPIITDEEMITLCVVHDITLRKANQQALQEQTSLIRLLQEIAISANEATSIGKTFQFAIDRICDYLGWPVGHALFFMSHETELSSGGIWASGMPEKYSDFKAISESIQFRPGYGLPGMVLEINQPVWLTNPAERPNFIRRKQIAEIGLQTALAIPVVVNKDIAAVLEFFSDRLVEPMNELLAVLPNLSTQLSRVIERRQAEEALRKREAQLKTVVTNLPVVLWVTDITGTILMFEGKGIAALGMKPGEMVGDSIYKRMQDYPLVIENVRRAMAGDEGHEEFTAASGLVFDSYYTPYYDVDGKVAGIIGVSLDITERKQMLTELDEMKHFLMENVETERMRLAQQIHDGPLQDLYGVFYQIQEVRNLLDGPAQSMADSSLTTIQDVNATLRFICGELRPTTLVHLGLNKAIQSHVERLQERKPDLTVHLEMMDDAQMLDPHHRLGLFRIYQNLISNVERHSAAKHAWVRLKIAEDMILLEVQDNGKGFDLPDNWIKMVRQGRVGLAATLERVEALNGKILFNTYPGIGTEVKVIIPRTAGLKAF